MAYNQSASEHGEETMTRALLVSICVALSASASGAEIGRLFFTPAERAQLDVARAQKKAPPVAAPMQAQETPAPEVVTYTGIVRRSDGKSMLWINNRVADEKEALRELNLKGTVRPDGAVSLHVPQSGASIEVKVGQSVELHSRRVAEGRKFVSEPHPPVADPNPAAVDAKAPAPATKSAPPESIEKKVETERKPEAVTAAADKQRPTPATNPK
jgi:hypothetical protein